MDVVNSFVEHSLLLVPFLILPWLENSKLHFPDYIATRVPGGIDVSLIKALTGRLYRIVWVRECGTVFCFRSRAI